MIQPFLAISDPLLDIPRVYTGIAEWLFSLVFILFAQKRLKGLKLYGTIIGFLGILIGFQVLAGTLPIYLWIPGMVFAVFLMFLFVYVTADVNMLTAGYITIMAFVGAEFAASFHWQMYYYAVNNFHIDFPYLSELMLVAIYGVLFYGYYRLESRYRRKGLITDVKQSDLLSFLGIGIIIFTISNISFVSVNTPISGRYPAEIFYIRSLVDFAGIVILFSQREHKLAIKSRIELTQMENLLKKQYEQYAMSQETMDIINQKYHDLKNQIAVIRAEKDADKKEQYLQELGQDLEKYRAQYNTGNEVLDTLLATKSMACIEHDIEITTVADGKLLNFISTMDLCSIFGNALDNAIENVSTIEDKEKRLIKIAVFSQNDLLLIRIENYFVNPLSYRDGELLTTKGDEHYHGYGLKSINSVVEKYNGNVNVQTDHHWFRLIVLIPIPPQS